MLYRRSYTNPGGLCSGNYLQSRCEGYNYNSVISEDSFQNVVSFTVKPINGNYGPWSVWTLCSKSCGGGVRSRVRNCTNPAPAFGGNDCSALGEPQESEPCNTRNICPGQYFAFYQSIVFFFYFITLCNWNRPLVLWSVADLIQCTPQLLSVWKHLGKRI